MSKPLNWTLDLFIKDEEQYTKLITHLGKSRFYSFEAEPHWMLESTTTHRIVITCSWTNNLRALTKWIDKNISDSEG